METQLATLPMDITDLSLTQKELIFIGEYCSNGFIEIDALKQAGLIPKNAPPAQARVMGLTLTNKPAVRTAIQRFTASVLNPYRDKLEYTELMIWQIRANYKISDFYSSDGKVRPLDSIPTDLHYAIDEIVEDFKGKDADVRTVRYKLADKSQAQKVLRELLKKADVINDDVDIPQDRQEWLAGIFAKAGAAGAIAGMNAHAMSAQVNATEPRNVTPSIIGDDFSNKLRDALSLKERKGMSGKSKET